jgi:hypothetical protein
MDTLHEVLEAPDKAHLLTWLSHQSLALYEEDVLMVHAGVLPQWTLPKTLALAEEIQNILRSNDAQEFFMNMYGMTICNLGTVGAARSMLSPGCGFVVWPGKWSLKPKKAQHKRLWATCLGLKYPIGKLPAPPLHLAIGQLWGLCNVKTFGLWIPAVFGADA